MNKESLEKMLGIPGYEEFAEIEEGVDAPFFIIYKADSDNNVYADGIVYHRNNKIGVELYLDYRNQDDLESKLEKLITGKGLSYAKEPGEYKTEAVHLFLAQYEMEVPKERNENTAEHNLKNVYYAVLKNGTYEKPKPIKGAITLLLEPVEKIIDTQVDEESIYKILSVNSYRGDLRMTHFPKQFRVDVFNDVIDTNGILTEKSNTEYNEFGLIYEYDSDEGEKKNVLYKCSARRPLIEKRSDESGKFSYVTEVAEIIAIPNEKGTIKATADGTVAAEIFKNWNLKIYEEN